MFLAACKNGSLFMKLALEKAVKAQKGSGSVALLFL
jgi:hypothetical protein